MREQIAAAIRLCGQTAEIRRGEERFSTVAAIQPVLQKWQQEPRDYTPAGGRDRRRWRYIGIWDTPLERYDTVYQGTAVYEALEATPVCSGGEVLYWSATLRLREEAME